jgi:hypothetical protein
VKIMDLEFSIQIEPATKILCIGASTYNTGTPQAVTQALQETNLLNGWAIIWAVHQYFDMAKKELFIKKINTDFHEIKERIIFVDKNLNYPIDKGYLYILPDSFWCEYSQERIYTRIVNDQDVLTIQASSCEEILEEDYKYMGYDPEGEFSEQPDPYLPCIDKTMIQLADNHTGEITGLLLAGLDADGAKGMLAIKKKGGKTAVQNPEECWRQVNGGYMNTSSMPRAAIAEAQNKELSHEIITLNHQNQGDTKDIKTLTEWLEFIKNN